MPITKRDVENLSSGMIVWDSGRGSVPGFGLRCQKIAKVFILKYVQGGRGRWYTIGKFGAPWTVEAARVEAKRLLGEIAGGGDPGADRAAKRFPQKPLSVGELCDRYMEAAQAGLVLTRFNRPKKASTLAIDIGRIERHIRPLIGALAVQDLDARIVKRLVADIAAGKTRADLKTIKRGRAIVTGGHGTAARVADLLSGIMSWAVDEDYVRQNPVHGVRRYRGEPRQRYLSEDELKRIGVALHIGIDKEERSIHTHALSIIELLCLSGCRLGEIAGLKWDEVDWQDRCLRLTDTKTGRSMRAVGSVVIRRLENCPRSLRSSYVFPAARGEGAYQGTKREIKRLFAVCGIEGASSHTLRHTYASIASGLGYSDATIAGLLGHAGRGVTSRYVHRPDEALMSAAEAVSSKIGRLLAPKERVHSAT